MIFPRNLLTNTIIKRLSNLFWSLSGLAFELHKKQQIKSFEEIHRRVF